MAYGWSEGLKVTTTRQFQSTVWTVVRAELAGRWQRILLYLSNDLGGSEMRPECSIVASRRVASCFRRLVSELSSTSEKNRDKISRRHAESLSVAYTYIQLRVVTTTNICQRCWRNNSPPLSKPPCFERCCDAAMLSARGLVLASRICKSHVRVFTNLAQLPAAAVTRFVSSSTDHDSMAYPSMTRQLVAWVTASAATAAAASSSAGSLRLARKRGRLSARPASGWKRSGVGNGAVAAIVL
ncbi:hypothetical protein V9T40_007513 [Parthenolecanium corni]|uniref:Uncharacterized protein n=1 Tax=Parthenolecanium corni TaxID=536013 RepID=A0AAN9TH71_9HEMI